MSESTITVSIRHTINLGNYESAQAHIELHNLPANATEEEMNTLLDTGKIAYRLMGERLKNQVQEIQQLKAKGA